MPCGKRPLVKKWDKPRKIRVINPSKYEQNLASVKVHWQNVIKDLEMSYKDEKVIIHIYVPMLFIYLRINVIKYIGKY